MSSTSDTIVEIPLDKLHESPFNPRKSFADADLQSLADNIKAEGRILQPLLVRPRIPALFANSADEHATTGYEIVFGHRRYRAAELAGLATAPCMVRSMVDAEVKRAQISENLQREDVHPLEEAAGFQSLIDEHNETAERIAEQIGKSKSYVYGRLKLLALCPEVRKACQAGEVDAEVALLIARLRIPKLQERALGLIKGKYLDLKDGGKESFRRVRELLNEHFALDLDKAPFPIDEEMLVPDAGNCVHCPKRSGNAPEYADIAADKNAGSWNRHHYGPDVCTDPTCFQDKKVAFFKRQADELRAKGKEVVDGNKARQAIDAHGNVKGSYIALKDAKDAVAEAKRAAQRDPTIVPPQIVTIQDPRGGKTVQAVKVSDLASAGVKLEKPGVKAQRDRENTWEKERQQREEKGRLESARRTALFHQVRDAARGRERSIAEARAIALVMIELMVDSDDADRLATLWGVPTDRPAPGEPRHWERAIAALPDADVPLLMLDCILVNNTEVDGWNLTHLPEGLHAIAALYGIPTTPGAATPSTAAQATKGAGKGKPSKKKKAAADGQEQTDDAGCAGGSDATAGDLVGAAEAA